MTESTTVGQPPSESLACSAQTPLGTRLYLPFRDRLRKIFGQPVYKITIDAGFTCPNLDGTLATGGCTFCNNESFSPPVRNPGPRESIRDQIERGMAKLRRRRPRLEAFLAYFQAYTNTYGPPDTLARLYDEALAVPGVRGLVIGTRPDCVPDPVLHLLADYARRGIPVFVEYGLQTANDRTLAQINRAHGVAEFLDAVTRTRQIAPEIHLGTHVILGLPNEGPADIRATARLIATTPGIDSVKVHHLYIARHTEMEQQLLRGELTTLSLAGFVALAADFLERIPEHIAIERLCGQLDGPWLVAPRWNVGKAIVVSRIEDELRRRGTRQGSLVGHEEERSR